MPDDDGCDDDDDEDVDADDGDENYADNWLIKTLKKLFDGIYFVDLSNLVLTSGDDAGDDEEWEEVEADDDEEEDTDDEEDDEGDDDDDDDDEEDPSQRPTIPAWSGQLRLPQKRRSAT